MDDLTKPVDTDGRVVFGPRVSGRAGRLRHTGRAAGLRVVLLRDDPPTAAVDAPVGFTVVGPPAEVDAAMRRVLAAASETVVDDHSDDPVATLRHADRLDPLRRTVVVAPYQRPPVPASSAAEDTFQVLLTRLTPQETRVLGLLAEGLTNRAIANEMHLAEKTVRNYVSNLLAKLRMQNRTQVAAFVARHGLIAD